MKHTKEPWEEGTRGPNQLPIIGAKDTMIAQIARRGEVGNADAKRILLCVNKCAGITDEALQAGIVCNSIQECLQLETMGYRNEYRDGVDTYEGMKIWEESDGE